jgi:hypothetical protein
MFLRSFYDETHISLGFLDVTAICEVSSMGQLPLPGFHDGKDVPPRFLGWDGYSCLVFRMGNIFVRSLQARTDVLAKFL